MSKGGNDLDKKIISLNKYRSKAKRPLLVNSQEEADVYIEELKEEFNTLLKNEKEGGEKNGRIRKNISKRT